MDFKFTIYYVDSEESLGSLSPSRTGPSPTKALFSLIVIKFAAAILDH